MDVADVVVVGGSVAGCATALHLAQRGRSVVLLERATFPREKPCGEGLMPHGVEELDRLGLGDAVRAIGMPFTGIAYHAGGRTAVGRFPDAAHPGLGVRRLRLDAILAEAARSRGGIHWRTTKVGDVRVLADGVEADTDDGPVRGRVLVGADGARSMVRRKLGLHVADERRPRYGARVHLRLAPGHADRDVVDVHLAKGCEFYLTPTGPGEVNVALLCEKDVTKTFSGDLWGGMKALLGAEPELAALFDGAEPVSEALLCGPLRQRTSGLVADRALLVGDAAGFVDAITGEGMSLALVSSRLAAETIDAALGRGEPDRAALRPYEDARAAFARDLVRLTEIVLWWVRTPWLARWVVGNLARRPDVFSRMLAVNVGQMPLSKLRPTDLLALAIGL